MLRTVQYSQRGYKLTSEGFYIFYKPPLSTLHKTYRPQHTQHLSVNTNCLMQEPDLQQLQSYKYRHQHEH